jgi:hypothetical protein
MLSTSLTLQQPKAMFYIVQIPIKQISSRHFSKEIMNLGREEIDRLKRL